ncbi:MAG: AEC family transporter [Lachnospiraceae bacterium]|nr:AEC family transporter [Lachnospiraceae bacterium]
MSVSIILQQMGVICILVAIGIYLYKKQVIDDRTSQKLSAIVVDVCNPALILSSILSGHMTATHSDLLIAIALGAAFYVILVIMGFIIPRILKSEPYNRKFYNLITVYTNTGFLGLPIAKAILPANAILYVIVINIFYSLFFYTHGMAILHSGMKSNGDINRTGQKHKHPLLAIFNIGTIMAVLSLFVFWFEITFPPIISNTIEYVGNATVFMSMTLLGVSIARSNFLKSFKNIRIWLYIVIRMIIVPVLFVIAMYFTGFNTEATLAVCLMAAVPAGSLPLITAEKMGLDTEILSSSIAMTTFMSVFTITAIMSVVSVLL